MARSKHAMREMLAVLLCPHSGAFPINSVDSEPCSSLSWCHQLLRTEPLNSGGRASGLKTPTAICDPTQLMVSLLWMSMPVLYLLPSRLVRVTSLWSFFFEAGNRMRRIHSEHTCAFPISTKRGQQSLSPSFQGHFEG